MIAVKKGIYRHYKGKLYQVLHSAQHSETEEVCVIYQQLYPPFGIWVRPYDNFISPVDRDGKNIVRFQYLDDTQLETGCSE